MGRDLRRPNGGIKYSLDVSFFHVFISTVKKGVPSGACGLEIIKKLTVKISDVITNMLNCKFLSRAGINLQAEYIPHFFSVSACRSFFYLSDLQSALR